jgi:hypothetical protein
VERAVERIEFKDIVARTTEQTVSARATNYAIITGSAFDHVVAGFTGEVVIAGVADNRVAVPRSTDLVAKPATSEPLPYRLPFVAMRESALRTRAETHPGPTIRSAAGVGATSSSRVSIF